MNHERRIASGGHVSKDSASAARQQQPTSVRDAADLRVLKAEKRALKVKLRRFEDDFIRQNGHKPQSYQEVGSIRGDYTRYKWLKEVVGSQERSGEN